MSGLCKEHNTELSLSNPSTTRFCCEILPQHPRTPQSARDGSVRLREPAPDAWGFFSAPTRSESSRENSVIIVNRRRNAKSPPNQTTLQIPAMGATLKSEGAGLKQNACEWAGKSRRIRLFALMKAGVSSQPWNRLLLLYIALLAASVHGDGKFVFWFCFFSQLARAERRLMREDARAPRLAVHYICYTVYSMEHLPCILLTLYTRHMS